MSARAAVTSTFAKRNKLKKSLCMGERPRFGWCSHALWCPGCPGHDWTRSAPAKHVLRVALVGHALHAGRDVKLGCCGCLGPHRATTCATTPPNKCLTRKHGAELPKEWPGFLGCGNDGSRLDAPDSAASADKSDFTFSRLVKAPSHEGPKRP